MKKSDEERYLDGCLTCFICKTPVPREDRVLHKTIVPLEKHPDHADPEFTHYYMICPECLAKGEII